MTLYILEGHVRYHGELIDRCNCSNEINYVIIAACIPTLRPLFLIVFGRPGREAYLRRYNHSGYHKEPKKSYVTSSSLSESKVLESRMADNSWLSNGGERHILPLGDISQTVDMDVVYSRKREGGMEEVLHPEGERQASSYNMV